VLVQVGLEGERLITSLAAEVLGRRVSLHVRPQVGPVSERLSAMGATVRLLTSM
jgi:hypothetical protein